MDMSGKGPPRWALEIPLAPTVPASPTLGLGGMKASMLHIHQEGCNCRKRLERRCGLHKSCNRCSKSLPGIPVATATVASEPTPRTHLWKVQVKRSVMSEEPLLSSSHICSRLGGLMLQSEPELPSMRAVTMSS